MKLLPPWSDMMERQKDFERDFTAVDSTQSLFLQRLSIYLPMAGHHSRLLKFSACNNYISVVLFRSRRYLMHSLLPCCLDQMHAAAVIFIRTSDLRVFEWRSVSLSEALKSKTTKHNTSSKRQKMAEDN